VCAPHDDPLCTFNLGLIYIYIYNVYLKTIIPTSSVRVILHCSTCKYSPYATRCDDDDVIYVIHRKSGARRHNIIQKCSSRWKNNYGNRKFARSAYAAYNIICDEHDIFPNKIYFFFKIDRLLLLQHRQ